MKDINWGKLVNYLLDHYMMTQADLATACSVSQQSISNWLAAKRTPGHYAQARLLEIAKVKGIDLLDFQRRPPALVSAVELPHLDSAVGGELQEKSRMVLRHLARLQSAQQHHLLDQMLFLILKEEDRDI